jgi:hypothetical protein
LQPEKALSATTLRQALIDIMEHGPNVCVRFRLIGQLWQPGFVRVVAVNDNHILVNDEFKNQLIHINLDMIVQFEVDHKFKRLEPHNHYDIIL